MTEENFIAGMRQLVKASCDGSITEEKFVEYMETTYRQTFKAGFQLGIDASTGEKDLPDWLWEAKGKENEY